MWLWWLHAWLPTVPRQLKNSCPAVLRTGLHGGAVKNSPLDPTQICLKYRILATHICPRVKIVSWSETSRFCIFRKTAGFWAADGLSRKAHRHSEDCFLGSPGGGTSLGQPPGLTRQPHSQPPDGFI